MSEFRVVEEFQRFLEDVHREDPQLVQREGYLLAKNCSDDGLKFHVPLYPLFLNPSCSRRYRTLGPLFQAVLDRTLGILRTPGHPAAEQMRGFLEIPEAVEEILLSEPRGGISPRVVRPDTVLHGPRIRTYEINVSWPGGVADADIIADRLYGNTFFKLFEQHLRGLGARLFRPPRSLSCALLLEQVLDAAGKEHPYIGVVMPTPDVPGFGGDELALSRFICDFFRRQGHRADVFHPHQITYDHDVRYEGETIDVIYRVFEWGHITGTHSGEYGPIIQAYMDGALPLVNSLHSEAVSAKSILELLACPSLRPCYEDLPLDPLLETFPRTITLDAGTDLEEFLENPEGWVLKGIKGSSSQSVLLGPATDPGFWQATVRAAAEQGGVVAQEYVDAPMMLMTLAPGEELVQMPRFVDVDPLYFGGTMGNVFARFSSTGLTSSVYTGGGMLPVVMVEDQGSLAR